MDHLLAVAEKFAHQGRVVGVREYGSGNVNDTFLVTLDSKREKHFILQRLNPQVFRRPELVMGNLCTVSDHVRQRLEHTPLSPGRRWEVPRVLLTQDGQDHFIDSEGSFWRALSFIEAAQTFDIIKDLEHAREVGQALGMFHNLLCDLPPERLADTLPGFHITPRYLSHYDEVLAKHGEGQSPEESPEKRLWERGPGADCHLQSLSQTLSPNPHIGGWEGSLRGRRGIAGRDACATGPPALPSKTIFQSSPEVDYALQFVSQRRGWAPVLEEAKAQGRLRLKPIHGDPKVNNFMMDIATGQAVSLVDLDTVKPGLVHYDIGDCLRSACNPLGEETERWETVRFEPELGRAILQGYLLLARDFLTADDYEYLYDAIRVIAFELGLRFFTDYLEGNVYFKAKHPEHNLVRALVQFKLTESIESQERALRAIIRDETSQGGG
ncbi:MAG: phosphotransferase [Desulfobaccales bacterium]|nr:phosphotransferase [Desulfobaccales bacterium]